MTARLFIGLGGNVGGEAAVRARFVAARAVLGAVASSSLWRTSPIGPEQPDYLNAVVAVPDHGLAPAALLGWIQAIEAAHGRDRAREDRWGPRTLDLDVLMFEGGRAVAEPALTVPHPRLFERRFALAPLAELTAIDPVALARVADQRCDLVARAW